MLVQMRHAFHRHIVSIINLCGSNTFACEPFGTKLWVRKLLLKVYCRLSSKRLRKYQKITRLSIIWPNELRLITDNISNSSNYWPWIHNALPTSNLCASFCCAIIETLNHLSRYNLSFFHAHLQWDAKHHEHMVNSSDAHSIDITKDIAAGYPSLYVRVFNKRIEKICRRN